MTRSRDACEAPAVTEGTLELCTLGVMERVAFHLFLSLSIDMSKDTRMSDHLKVGEKQGHECRFLEGKVTKQ